MERLCSSGSSSSSSNRKNPNKNKEIMVSAKNEKSLRDWKLPPFPASYAYEPSGCCSLNSRVKTVEKKIPLSKGYTIIPLLSENRRIEYLKRHDLLEVGMIQVGLKPQKLGSNTSAIMCVRDKRRPRYHDSIIGMAASSLCDGPIYFSCLPAPHYLVLSNCCDAFNIDVKIEGSSLMHGGDGNITLMYRFHYRLNTVEKINKGSAKLSKPDAVDEKGKTTLYLTNIAQRNSVGSKTISWGETEVGEGLMLANNNLISGGAVGGADVDWKETAKAHVLKVDVPGFKKEEVRVSVDEDGRILLICGERSNAEKEEEEEIEKWHCEERSGKFFRRLRLPETARLDGLKAGMETGVLTVTVPKEEVKTKKKPELKFIDISG